MTIDAQLQIIRVQMPRTYAEVRARADQHGAATFSLVRRALRGEPNCFYAVEAGHVVGTPFADRNVTDQLAGLMVRFGLGFLVIWPAGEDGDD